MSGTGRLAGKVALVTGGSRGLGRGIAEGFATEGARVVVNYMNDEKAANTVVETIKQNGSDAIMRARQCRRGRRREMHDRRRRRAVRHDRHSGQQRRLAELLQARRHVGRDVGRDDQGPPARHVPVHAVRHPAHAQAEKREDHQHERHLRRQRRSRVHPHVGRQGRDDRVHARAGTRGRPRRHPRELHRARHHPHGSLQLHAR